jgi:Tol biopolymer transport system component
VLLTPIPEGTPPSDLTSLYYVADTGSGPELRAIGIDQQGRRWPESELAIGQFPANLVGLHPSPDGRYLALEFIGDRYAEVKIMERSSGRTWCPLREPAMCWGEFWDWTFDNRLLFAPLNALFGDVIPWGVMVVDLETGQYTQPPGLPTLQSGTSRVQNVTASPDRAVLAYSIVEVEDGQEITEIWTTRFDGGDKQLVRRVRGAINTLSWSPAGEQLIYVYQSEPGQFFPAELWLLGTDGGSARLLATDLPMSDRHHNRPAWSPDGRYVTFTQLDLPIAFFSAFALPRSNMWVVDTITGQVTRLSSFENREVAFPTWSPDGRFVAFVSTAAAGEGMPYDETLYSEVWVASADGTQLYAVSGTTRWNYALAWLTPTSASGTPQESPAARVLQGSGVFPRLAVAAPAADGITLALYLIEGDSATQLMALEGTRDGVNRAVVQLSPDGRYVACLRTEGDYLRLILEVIDTQTAQRALIAEGAKDAPEHGAASETLTSVAWMDAGHILYSKVRWPSSEEWTTSWEAGTPLSVRGEVWLSDVEGQEQRLLASGSIHRVLAMSPGGNTLYVTRLIRGREAEREEGFALLDLGSGEVKNLWPQEERGAERYHSFKLIALPDGTRRLLFATAERGDTAPTQPPVIWMADPESGYAEAIATIDQGRTVPKYGTAIYDIPRDFLWSPRSEREFIYLADGAALGGVWRVDLDAGTAEPLGGTESLARTGLRLVAWTPEGIVIQNQDALWLLDESGEVRGEIRFREETALAPAQILSTVVNWEVPYVHQIYDTPDWFHRGWTCWPGSDRGSGYRAGEQSRLLLQRRPQVIRAAACNQMSRTARLPYRGSLGDVALTALVCLGGCHTKFVAQARSPCFEGSVV